MRQATTSIGTGMVLGTEAIPIQVEATTRDGSDGVPRILGLVDTAVREAYHRVLHALHALGLPSPRGVTTLNFCPGTVRKHGAGFDLPLALAMAGTSGALSPHRTEGLCAIGEVSLLGRLLPARGAVCVALMAQRRGDRTLLCSPADAALCQGIEGLTVLGAETVADAIFWATGQRDLLPPTPRTSPAPGPTPDLADIRGQQTAKLALCVAAAGGHNLLMVGPPGSGKTALCRRLPGLLPPPTPTEALQVLAIHTAAGLPDAPSRARPLRAPHHSSSCASLLGGGQEIRPGEASLAHHGVLFLDELPEFRRDALEGLRQPLEDGCVTIGRASWTATMPAGFALVAAMNPCPCGYRGHPSRPCTCLPTARARYRSRVSGPLLDRLDLQVEVPALDAAQLGEPPDAEWATARLQPRVLAARQRQLERNRWNDGEACTNARLQDGLLESVCSLDAGTARLLVDVLRLHDQGGRSRVRLLRVARTLADLAGRETIAEQDLLEAAELRGYARRTD